MPEGDTIHHLARRLSSQSRGQRVAAFHAIDPRLDSPSVIGARLAELEARGKNLLMHFDGPGAEPPFSHRRITLHSHLLMRGWWRYESRRVPARPLGENVRVVIELERVRLIGLRLRVLRFIDETRLSAGDPLKRLGPDLLSAGFDGADAAAALLRMGSLPLGEAMLLQRGVAGIGNVYKSELLFLEGLNPFAAVSAVSQEILEQLLGRAQRWMRRNLAGGPRRTRFVGDGPPLWVYGRAGEHCLKCGERIQMQRQGQQLRSTYYCPQCQQR